MSKLFNLRVLFLIFNFSCSSVPDVPVCVELDVNRGWCTHTISNTEYFVEDDKENPLGTSWWELTPTMVYLPHSSWAQIKSYIQKKCKKQNDCKNVSGWDSRVKRLGEMVNR